MIDVLGREITTIRISVTQKCNLKCPYCHKEGETASGEELGADRIVEIVTCAAKLGVQKVKFTGGEPLLRKDIVSIVRSVSKIEGIEEVSMTTNGVLLERMAGELAKAGLGRINIGCDSLSSSIAGIEKTKERIEKGLIAAKAAGLDPIKLNMVVMRSINDSQIDDAIDFARKEGAVLQLIELVPFDKEFFKKHFYSLSGVEDRLKSSASEIITRKMNSRKQYVLNGAVVEIVRPYLNRDFCRNCGKIRVTSDGKLKPCLMRDDNLVDIRKGDLTPLFREALKRRELQVYCAPPL